MKKSEKVAVVDLKQELHQQVKSFTSNYEDVKKNLSKRELESLLDITIISNEIFGTSERDAFIRYECEGVIQKIWVHPRPSGRINLVTAKFAVKRNKESHKYIICEM